MPNNRKVGRFTNMATFVDVEDESVLENIFKDSFPESWTSNPDFLHYLAQLSSYGVDKLSKEPERLSEEKSQILEETQDLAFHNYKTFIQTAECSREIYQDFKIIENHVGSLLEKLPNFHGECEKFLVQAQDIAASRKMNSLTLQRHTQLLEILEVPQLMDTCVRNGYYDEALELMQHVKRWEKKFATIPVIVDIVRDVRNSSQLMLNQLIRQLRSNIQLPACLRVIGYLRRMDVFLEPELRIKFLQARDSWFQGILAGIPTDDPYTHITKTIELSRVYLFDMITQYLDIFFLISYYSYTHITKTIELSRVHLFDVITQYRAIFSDEDPWLSSSKEQGPNESGLFHGWVIQKVSQFIATLEVDLRAGVGGRLDSILGQCMYFGLSFSRVGADFRGLLAPVFQHAALEYFQAATAGANARFESYMQTYNLLSTPPSGTSLTYSASSQPDTLNPPTTLLDYPPLASYCNDILAAFNDLRLCAPLAVACDVATNLEHSLDQVNHVILAFHRAEESAFDDKERDEFRKFCEVYINDLVPYINRCLQALFPASQIASVLGVTVNELNSLGKIAVIDEPHIADSIQHLLPTPLPEPESNATSDLPVENLDTTQNQSDDLLQNQNNNSDQSSTVSQTIDQSSALSQTIDQSESTLHDAVAAIDQSGLTLQSDDVVSSATAEIDLDSVKGDNFNVTKLTDENETIDLDKVFQIASDE